MEIPEFLQRGRGDPAVPPPEFEWSVDDSPAVQLPDDLTYQQVYYVRGGAPKSWPGSRYCIKDPPTSGFAHAFILGEGKHKTVFCPFTLESYRVPDLASEIQAADPEKMTEDRVARLSAIISTNWATFSRLGLNRDYDIAALVLLKLGAEVPRTSVVESVDTPRKERRKGGKPCGDTLLKPVRRSSKRGQIAEFFLGSELKSIRECMARFDMSRNSVLSALHNLNKDHGLGYETSGDTASILIPPDWDIWGE